MSNDGFIDKAGEAARKVFGNDEGRDAGGSYAAEQPRKAVDYPMGGDDAVAAGSMSHYGAQGGREVRVGGGTTDGVTGDRGQYDDDPHYQQTRASHLNAFDRDYHDFRREHGTASDFATWHAMRSGSTNPQSSGEPGASLALGEGPSQGSGGPHILDRSFSGTYDKD